MAQATEQGGDHVLVAEEVQPVIVVEVGRDSVESKTALTVGVPRSRLELRSQTPNDFNVDPFERGIDST